ncbi:hypothetical protein M8J76_001885 [Diaphorina citri]|nr:hypothetical protein M8J75_012438 [Diaphorina citri]KAI5748783.1 hypothetical protein M8J76_001885 [Diaphorina citri]
MFTFRIFTFIVNLLEEITDLAENDFLKNNLVSHLISLSTELGPECKAALCKLGEVVLPRLIHLIYEQQKTGSTLAVISQLYKALLSQFNTHHPLGIDCKESFFVGDAEKWNSILKRVYYMIESEISHLQRSKETECNSDFIHLAVHLIGWFYNKSEEVSMCDVTIDLDTSVRAKRMKLTVLRIEYFIQVLEQSNSAYDIWPVLHIVACLVFRFPKLITSEEYKVLLQLFAAYQSNNFTNNEKIMDYLYEAFFSFLFALEHVTFPDDQVNQIWKNIFQNTNKIIGLNQCVRSSHLLLRYLLNLKYDLCHTDLLMQSYTDKVVSLNEESLKTLFFLISKVQINTETRLKLMDWIFQRTTTKITSLHLYTATATMFILCSNVRPLQLETSKSELDHFFAFLQPSSLEYFYTTNNFDQGIFTGKTWYDSFETLLTFPYHILSLDINTFLNANLIHIVTVLYINKNGNEIGHYAKLLSKDVSSLVLVALPKILALGSRDMIVSSEQFESCDLVRNKLEDVLLELLCNVSDYKHLNMKACVPQPCASNITFIQLKSRLEFLTIKLDLNVSPIQYLCQNKPSSIQKIHLHLSRAIYEARSSEFRIEAIHRYEMFLQLLEPILNQSNDLILDFLIHSVIYTLLHTLGSSNEAVDCANIVLNCMNRFLHATLPQCSSIISTLLPCLVGSLVPITHAQLKKECLCIIEFLVVDHCKELREGILALDPFPHSEDYKVISQVYNNFRGYLPRTCLSKEIGHFVASTYSNPHCKITQQCRLEGLNNIDHLLTHERKDLNIINSSQLSNFELDKLEKMMNRLIFILSELARSPDSEISNKALVCLGKIGPYSMNSTALASHESQMNTAHTSNGDLMLTQVITAKLILYLSSSNVKVVSIASECLFNLLDTPEGRSIVDKLSSAQRKFIYPMLPTHNKCLVKASLEDLFDERKFKELIDVTGLWVPNTATTYERWISHLTANMIICFETSKCYLKYLIELCSIKTDFAEEILRYLIYFIIRIPSETREAENILTTRIGYFFSCHHNAVSSRNSTDGEIHMNKKAIKCLLDVIHFVRINQDSPDKTLLRVNYLHVAQAALYCSAPFSAIFYSHISSEQLCSELELEYRDQSLSTLDYICNYRSTEGPNLQDILRRAYTEINDLDAVQGCGNAHLRELSSRIVHYQNANNWQRVLQCSDILMSTSGQSEQMKMSLAKCGLYFIQTRISESQDLEASWRLSQWDYADDLSEEPTFDLYHYRALKCLHQGETIQCMDNINAARKSLVNFLCLTDMECTKQVQLVLSKLRMLQEIQEFTEVDSNDIIIHKWEENQFIGDVDFKLIEPILYQRCILLDESCDESMAIVPYYLKIAQRARIANHFHIAERILTTVDGKSLSKFDKFQVLFELSQLLWDRNEIEAARASLRIILPKMHDESKCKLIYSQALRTYGCWQASTKSENLSSIIRKYLQPALEILLCDQLHERLKAYNCLATYADEKQLQISDILISVSKMQRPDVPYGSKIEMKQQAIDARETETHKLERKTYLHMSMKYYIKSLAEGNLNDIKAFRVVSLWLDNIDDTDLLNMLAKSIITVPSYKFVKVLPQLVARISNVQNKPNALILQVIEKCAVDHPHHTLPLIMAVANSLKDEIYIKKSSELPVKSSTMESRIKGADYVIMKLKKLESPFCKNLVEITRQQEALSYAYIIFANYVLGDARYSASKHTIPSSQQLIKIKDFDQICVSTMNLKLNIDGIYDSIVGIHKFDRTYCIPGGVNEPKKITCIGTDGHRYIQLLKGKDDPRQDAVMQQVFTIMNDLLKSKRNLSVMTYKVVPLSQMSGIIEWCTNSLPVCLYLLGDNTTLGAHAKYNPQDITHRKCRECLEKLHKASAPTSKKLNEYLNICKKFKPVFRYFFLEQFQNPNEWYNMQTNYTRSVATSSMIGYILGLGDRHLNNILINLKTAQVIHIDFGIAFEQGLILPTPETVPFRLTRDVEDGMGVTGTEGTFKKTCETTLSVLRENSETLLTILEVLLYDPLYTWTLTPSKAAERQKVTNSKNVNTETNVPVNKIAARALFRLKQKLQGIEEGNVFSVEGQVSILIQRAKDPENLCRLFPGWQPYL